MIRITYKDDYISNNNCSFSKRSCKERFSSDFYVKTTFRIAVFVNSVLATS